MSKTTSQENLIHELRAECQQYLIELAQKDQEIARLNAHIDDQKIQIAHQQGVSSIFRSVYNRLDNSVMEKINRRGAVPEMKVKKYPVIQVESADSIEAVLREIRKYDIADFFDYRPVVQKSHLKPHYRVFAKSYRTIRDGALGVAKKSVRAVRKGES